MADDDSRNEDAKKRPGKSSKPAGKGKADKPGKADKSGAKKGGKEASSSKKTEDKADKGELTKAEESAKSGDKGEKKTAKKDPDASRGPVGRVLMFFREIVEQLRKVVYPTRKQLLTYTAVVLVFVSIMIAVISGYDWAFSHGVKWMLGADSGGK